MRYKLPETLRRKALKRYQISLTVQYALGFVVFVYVLIVRFNDSGFEIKGPIIFGILLLPVAWWLFVRNMKNKLSSEYEVTSDNLLVFENGNLKNQIPFNSIQRLTKITNAHRVEWTKGNAYILDGVDEKEQLLNKIQEGSGLSDYKVGKA